MIPSETTIPLIFRPPRTNQIGCWGVCGMISLLWVLLLVITPQPWNTLQKEVFTIVGIILVIIFLPYGIFYPFIIAELNETQFTRRSIFGTKSLPLNRIETALIYRSDLATARLEVRTSEEHLNFPLNTFSLSQLQQMQDFLKKQAINSSRPLQTVLPEPTGAIAFAITYLVALSLLAIGIIAWAITHRPQ